MSQVARIDTPLKQVLQSEGRKLTWLAEQIGASKQEVGRWVHGLHVPQHATQVRIAQALGKTVDELWPETNEQVAA